MEKQECPGCAVEVDIDTETCPICGYEFPSSSSSLQVMAWIMIILAVLWLVF